MPPWGGEKACAPKPDSPLRYDSGLASPFIAGTPPASSSGRGRGSISTSLFSLSQGFLCGVHGCVVVFVFCGWGSRSRLRKGLVERVEKIDQTLGEVINIKHLFNTWRV